MSRFALPFLVLCSLVAFAVLATPRVTADEPKPAAEEKPDPVPPQASDEEAAEALAAFKVAWRAKGFRGEEKTAERAWAIRELAKVQHADVIDTLSKLTRERDIDLRTSAVVQLGEQRALPGYAGEAVLKALQKNQKDDTFVMAALSAIGRLRYLGAKAKLVELMKHHEYAVVKNVLVTIGELGDARFIEEIVKLMKDLKLEKGAKWDGVSVTYDTGTAGDHDQKMAEKIGKEKQAKNSKKGKRAAKSMRDLGPVVLEVMFKLTGEQFSGGIQARKWLKDNREKVDARVAEDAKTASEQAQQAKDLKKR